MPSKLLKYVLTLLLIALLCLPSLQLAAQRVQWTQSRNGNRVVASDITSSGQITLAFENGNHLLSQYDNAGILNTSFNTGDGIAAEIHDLVHDADDNIYLVGSFNGTTDFNPSISFTKNVTPIGSSDAFLAKFDTLGNFLWVKHWGSLNEDVEALFVEIDGANLIVAGFYRNTVDFDPGTGVQNESAGTTFNEAYLSKIDTAGNFVDVLTLTTGATGFSEPKDMKLVGSDLYVAFDYSQSLQYDTSGAVQAAFGTGSTHSLIKYNLGFGSVWKWEFNHIDAFSIDANATDVYAVGTVNAGETTDLDPGFLFSTVVSPSGEQNGFIARYNAASGALVGNGEFTGNWPASSEIDVSTNSSGDVYVIGDFRGIVDFDPGAGVLVDTSTFVGAVATSDIFVAKYNASLAYQWQWSTGSTLFDASQSIHILNDGFLMLGTYNGTVDFDFGAAVRTLAAGSSRDIFIARYDTSAVCLINPQLITASGVNSFCADDTLLLNTAGVQATTLCSWKLNGSSLGATSDSLKVGVGGLYTLILTNPGVCVDSTSLNIVMNPLPVVRTSLISSLLSLCESDAALLIGPGNPNPGNAQPYNGTLRISGVFNPPLDTSYVFLPSFNLGQSFVQYTYVDPITGCTDSIIDTVQVNGDPVLTFSTVPNFCYNGFGDTLDFALPLGGSWSGLGIQNDSLFDPNTFGLIVGNNDVYYSFVDSFGCSTIDTASILVTAPPSVSFNMTANFCDGEEGLSLLLDPRVFADPLGGVFSGVGVSGDTLSPSELALDTIYDITYAYTDASGCSDTGVGFYSVHQTPSFTFTGGSACEGIDSRIGVEEEFFYEWSTGETTQSIDVNITEPTSFAITVYDFFCSASDSVDVDLIEPPTVTANLDYATGPYNNPLTDIDVLANDIGDFERFSILFSPSNGSLDFGGSETVFDYIPNQDFRRTDTLVYEICDPICFDICDTGIAFLSPYGDPHDFIPNAFTPNGDFVNEFFVIPGIEAPMYTGNEFVVFNVYGDRVYKATDYRNTWDGSPQGNVLPGVGGKVPDGTYYYILKLAEDDVLTGFIDVRTK